MMAAPAAIPVGAIIGAAALGAGMQQSGNVFSTAYQYNLNKKIMDKQYGYTELAALNQYPWMVESLRRAGLNPILAAQGGLHGSSMVPTGGPGVSALPMSQPDIGSTARAFEQAKTEEYTRLEKIQNVDKIISEASLNVQKRLESVQATGESSARVEKMNTEARKMNQEIKVMGQNLLKLRAEIELIDLQKEYTQADTAYKQRLTSQVKQQEELLKKEVRKLASQLKKINKMGEVYEGWYGDVLSHLEAFTGALGLHGIIGISAPTGKR